MVSETSGSRPYLAALAAALGLILALRIVALAANGTDLFFDEAQYWSWSREPAFGYFSKPPLIAWIIAAATQICGDSEFCVRLPVPIIHTATSALVFLIGARLYSTRVGFWSAIAFATLPGISFSSGIISTDVPLLFAWALALVAFIGLVREPGYGYALLLGLALGVGLNAKYAMAYFVPSAAIFFLLAPQRASLLERAHLSIALGIGLALITPNLLWNRANAFATFAHTAENTGWTGDVFHPAEAAEFLLSQFGVFGPILFGALIAILWRTRRALSSLEEADRLLIAFSAPLLLAVTLQALVSHAFANWAAPAYVAASALVTAVLIREGAWGWLKASLALNAAIGVLIAIGTWQAGNFSLPGIGDPFARTLGNRELAEAVRSVMREASSRGTPPGAVVADDRDLTAVLLYYAPEIAPKIRGLRRGAAPRDHYELTRPLTASDPAPVLLISRKAAAPEVLALFASARDLGARTLAAGPPKKRRIHFYAVSGLRDVAPGL